MSDRSTPGNCAALCELPPYAPKRHSAACLEEQLAAERAAREAAEGIVRAIRADLVLSSDDDVPAAVNRLLLAHDAALTQLAALRDDHTELTKDWATQVEQIAALREEVMTLQVDGSAYDRGYRRADDVARTRITELEQQLAALREVGQSLIDHAEQGQDEALEDRDEYKLVAKAATEYADVVLAQLAARDQQLAAQYQIIDELFETFVPPGTEGEHADLQRRIRKRLHDLVLKPSTPDPRDQQLAALREGIERLREAWTHEHWDKVVVAREALFALLSPPSIEQQPGDAALREAE